MNQIVDISGDAQELPHPAPGGGLSVIREEIDIQIATARAYPRSLDLFRRNLRAAATISESAARQCVYSLPRGKNPDGTPKFIEGPSIRFAEIAAAMWGNCRVAGRIVGATDTFVIAQGVFHDLQSNMAYARDNQRRITDRNGNRYNDDMIGVTGNAATSIAIRNAILAGVPQALWRDAYLAARLTISGDEKSFDKRRMDALTWFAGIGVDKAAVFEALDISGLDDLTPQLMMTLGGFRTAIEDEGVSLASIFPNAKTAQARKAASPTPPDPDGAAPQADGAGQTPPAPKEKNSTGAPSGASRKAKTPAPPVQLNSMISTRDDALAWLDVMREAARSAVSLRALNVLRDQAEAGGQLAAAAEFCPEPYDDMLCALHDIEEGLTAPPEEE